MWLVGVKRKGEDELKEDRGQRTEDLPMCWFTCTFTTVSLVYWWIPSLDYFLIISRQCRVNAIGRWKLEWGYDMKRRGVAIASAPWLMKGPSWRWRRWPLLIERGLTLTVLTSCVISIRGWYLAKNQDIPSIRYDKRFMTLGIWSMRNLSSALYTKYRIRTGGHNDELKARRTWTAYIVIECH